MANQLTNTPIKNVYTEYGDAASARSNIIGLLLRFTKHGQWVAGQDRKEVPVGTRMIAHIPGVKIGWVKWSEGQPVENNLGLLSEGFQPPQRDTLGDLDKSLWGTLGNQAIDPWQFANFCMMYCPDNNELYTFTTGSKGGLGALGGLISTFGRHFAAKPSELPIVQLETKSYNHREFGETFVPVFKLVGWTETTEELISATDTPQDFIDEIVDDGDPNRPTKQSKPRSVPLRKQPRPWRKRLSLQRPSRL